MRFECGERIIDAWGFLGNEGVEVNDSSIWNRLVQEAGRKCDHFASDILLDWQMYKKELERSVNNGENRRWLFGFRNSGVDHTEWVENDSGRNLHQRV